MTADKFRLELELIDGSFQTRLSQTRRSVQTLKRDAKSALDSVGVTFQDAAAKSGNALQKLAIQMDAIRKKLATLRKAVAGVKDASATLETAGQAAGTPKPAASAGAKTAAAPTDTGEKTPDPKTMSFEQLMRSWGNTTARLKEGSKGWLTGISEELSKQLVTGKSSWGRIRGEVLTGLVQTQIQAIMSKLFSGGLFGWLDKGLKLLPDAVGKLFDWLSGDTAKKSDEATASRDSAPAEKNTAAKEPASGSTSDSASGAEAPKEKKKGFDDLMAEWGDTTASLKKGAAEWLPSLSSELSTQLVTGKSNWGRIRTTILTGLVQTQIQGIMSKLFGGGLFDWLDKGFKMIPDMAGGLFDWVGKGLSTIVGWFHSGGIVGMKPAFSSLVPSNLFANAKKFHTGGFPGLRSDEVPAILRKGEGVFTPEQMSSLGGQVVNQTVNVNLTATGGTPQQNGDLAERIGRQVQEQLRGMVAGEIRQQMRPGGMLAV